MNLELERINNPMMEFYRNVYRYSKRWNSKDPLAGKKVIVYFEQGYGDIIQFLRYLKPLRAQGCEVIAAIPPALFPIMDGIEGLDGVHDKHCSVLPKHDYHILSLSLPFLLEINEISSEPYISFDRKADLEEHTDDIKIGIAWEGSPEHPNNLDRCCPLKHFKILLDEGVKLFMLQNKVYLQELTEGVDDTFPLYGVEIKDFGDTAALINAVDFVVTVDTSVLHLAGAMGKKTYGILSPDPDPRWKVGNWYDSVTLLSGEWEFVLNVIKTCRSD